MQTIEMGWFNILNLFYDFVMREICLEAWLTRYRLRVWMASSMIGKNDPQRYIVVIKILCLA
jgi:hypothetical protein